MSAPRKILLINPNSAKSMTAGLEEMIFTWKGSDKGQALRIVLYTASSGPVSINDHIDAEESARVVFEDLQTKTELYDAFLVACYSVHPLTGLLRSQVGPRVPVIGIFEASIAMALSLLPLQTQYLDQTKGYPSSYEIPLKFGIISTGVYYEKALSDGVMSFLGTSALESSHKFKGVETTGLNASELHSAAPELVRSKMIEATKRLVKDRDVNVICLGCAGMSGLDEIIGSALIHELGEDEADKVHIIDGVKAGIAQIEGLLQVLPRRKR